MSAQRPKLDPKLRERLLKESRNPFVGLRRNLWIVFFASALLGLFIMTLRTLSGEIVQFSDAMIQLSALLLFGFLIIKDRDKSE